MWYVYHIEKSEKKTKTISDKETFVHEKMYELPKKKKITRLHYVHGLSYKCLPVS